MDNNLTKFNINYYNEKKINQDGLMEQSGIEKDNLDGSVSYKIIQFVPI
jgi:hypothetical protein